MVKPASGIQAGDGLAEDHLKSREVFVRLREFSARIAEEVLHIWNALTHVDCERA